MIVFADAVETAVFEPIRVLHVIDTLAVGGAERVLVEFVNSFDKRSILPLVCVTRSVGDTTLAKDLRSDVTLFQLHRTRRWDLSGLKQFGEIIRENRIEIVHAHGYGSANFSVAAKFFNALRTPLIVHAHNSIPPSFVARLIVRIGSKHLIANSPQLVEWSKSLFHLRSNDVSLLGNAIDATRYSEARATKIWGDARSRPRFVGLVIANVNPVKDFETLFRGIASSRFKRELHILVAGSTTNSDYVATCRALLSDLQIGEQVTFLGTRHDIPELLASADFGLLSSISETGPIALLEYMAAGLPFVSTRVGQVGNVARQVLPQSFVEVRDCVAFGKAIDDLLDLSDSDRRKYGTIGRNLLGKHFNLSDRSRELGSLYARLVTRQTATKQVFKE